MSQDAVCASTSSRAAPPTSLGRSPHSSPGSTPLKAIRNEPGTTGGKRGGHTTGKTQNRKSAPNPQAGRSARRAGGLGRLPRARPDRTHKVSNRSLAAPSKVSLCRFWNVSQRSRWSPKSSVATEDVGVAGVGGGGGGSSSSSGGGSPGPTSWARGDNCLGRCFADDCLTASPLPPRAWAVGRRARLEPGAEAAAAGALEARGRSCPRRSEDAVFRVCRMAPAAWCAGLAARAPPPPRAPAPLRARP